MGVVVGVVGGEHMPRMQVTQPAKTAVEEDEVANAHSTSPPTHTHTSTPHTQQGDMDHYKQAAGVLKGVLKKKGSIKTLALASDIRNKRFVSALVTETLKHKSALDSVLERSGLQATLGKQVRDPFLLYLLLFDFLFGKGIQGGGQVKRTLKEHEAALRKATEGLVLPEKYQGSQQQHEHASSFPRYARVNTLKMTLAEVRAKLASSSSFRDVKEDAHIPNLLGFPPGTDLHDHPLVLNGALVLQDKASCFSAQALLGGDDREPLDGDVIDACAAPGNKTAHAAALLKDTAAAAADRKKNRPRRGIVYAFDKDKARLDVLRKRVVETMRGKGLVVPLLQDFLLADAGDPRFKGVKAILLDPSCSGSGMLTSLERQYESYSGGGGGGGAGRKVKVEEVDDPTVVDEVEGPNPRATIKDGGATQRLRALAQFQYKALTKALLGFPQVQRVVYSTCSLHAEENEMVVAAALAAQQAAAASVKAEGGGEGGGGEGGEEAEAPPPPALFELRPALPAWPRRGLSQTADGKETGLSPEQAACVARTDPHEDLTNGFFVAYFERPGIGGGKQKKQQKEKKDKATQKKKKRPREEVAEEEEGAAASKKSKTAKRRERRKKKKQLGGEGGGSGDGEDGKEERE